MSVEEIRRTVRFLATMLLNFEHMEREAQARQRATRAMIEDLRKHLPRAGSDD